MEEKENSGTPDQFSEQERLKLSLLTERKARLQAEQRALNIQLQLTESNFVATDQQMQTLQLALRTKYSLGLHDKVDLETGHITRAPKSTP